MLRMQFYQPFRLDRNICRKRKSYWIDVKLLWRGREKHAPNFGGKNKQERECLKYRSVDEVKCYTLVVFVFGFLFV